MADDEHVKQTFFSAIELDRAERELFLRRACGDDPELRSEVLALLECHDRGDDFLETPVLNVSAGEIAENLIESEAASAVGRLVGVYRIESEIGRGGMGSVYLAARADQEFTKHVAIKLLRRGTENESVVRRFKQERQVLADLEHPHIARLIDGGTSENGLPYLVMEYVAGRPIDKFCDEHRLSTTERLILFRQVCAAVEFAHEHAIIHRDLKPGNIHVNDKGVPKLLDFGIAKSSKGNLNADSTATAFRLMTPEYASPEQMRGDTVGKPSDIYSLGVVLYQLISGRRPYDLDKKSPFQIVQAICEEMPAAPSSIPRSVEQVPSPRMSGELDQIVLKALRKEPEHRYGSVREFSDDIGRLLEGLPVNIRREPLRYRAAKFYARHRAAVLSLFAASLVLLVAGLSFGIWNRAKADKPSPAEQKATAVRMLAVDDRSRGGTENPEARELYLKAEELWQKRTSAGLNLAANIFQEAVDKDPDFALAYSGLANCYILLGVWGMVERQDAFHRAKPAAIRSIEAAPGIPEGHLSLAMIHWLNEYDWPAADAEFKKAVQLGPTYSRAPHWYGLFLAEMGRFEEALTAEKRAAELEPESVPVKADLARVLYYARRYDQALAQYRGVIKTYPAYDGFYAELSELYEATGMIEEFVTVFERLYGSHLPELRNAYRKGGMQGYWRMQASLAEQSTSSQASYRRAETYAQLGQQDRAIDLIEQAIAEKEHRISQLKVNPRFDVLRSHPRFIAILKRMRLDS